MFHHIVDGHPFAYEIKYSANNDYNTFFKLLCQGKKFTNLSEKLLYYRIHGDNDTLVHVKEKFFNTLKVRIDMVVHFGYKLSFKTVAMSVVQSCILVIFPEKLLVRIYLFSKGISKPSLPRFLTTRPALLSQEAE